jgi:hypothetical protein
MKFIISILVLFLVINLHGQTMLTGRSVGDSYGNKWSVTNEDSVYFDSDTLFIHGADTAYFAINTGASLGMITFKGDVFAGSVDSAVVRFSLAKYKGYKFGSGPDNIVDIYYPMDSCFVAASGIDGFYFYPFQNVNFQDYNHSYFYILKIAGTVGNLAKIWLREEILEAY